jgi:hypothetical protein
MIAFISREFDKTVVVFYAQKDCSTMILFQITITKPEKFLRVIIGCETPLYVSNFVLNEIRNTERLQTIKDVIQFLKSPGQSRYRRAYFEDENIKFIELFDILLDLFELNDIISHENILNTRYLILANK